MPSFKDGAGASSTTIDNIGLAKTSAGSSIVVSEVNSTSDPKPRSTLISNLKLSGLCIAGNNGATGANCRLTAKLGNKTNVAIKGTQIQLFRTADGAWTCEIREPNPKGGWKDKFIPSGCTKNTGNVANNGWIS